jgi:hypothetical protein
LTIALNNAIIFLQHLRFNSIFVLILPIFLVTQMQITPNMPQIIVSLIQFLDKLNRFNVPFFATPIQTNYNIIAQTVRKYYDKEGKEYNSTILEHINRNDGRMGLAYAAILRRNLVIAPDEWDLGKINDLTYCTKQVLNFLNKLTQGEYPSDTLVYYESKKRGEKIFHDKSKLIYLHIPTMIKLVIEPQPKDSTALSNIVTCYTLSGTGSIKDEFINCAVPYSELDLETLLISSEESRTWINFAADALRIGGNKVISMPIKKNNTTSISQKPILNQKKSKLLLDDIYNKNRTFGLDFEVSMNQDIISEKKYHNCPILSSNLKQINHYYGQTLFQLTDEPMVISENSDKLIYLLKINFIDFFTHYNSIPIPEGFKNFPMFSFIPDFDEDIEIPEWCNFDENGLMTNASFLIEQSENKYFGMSETYEEYYLRSLKIKILYDVINEVSFEYDLAIIVDELNSSCHQTKVHKNSHLPYYNGSTIFNSGDYLCTKNCWASYEEVGYTSNYIYNINTNSSID